MSRSRVFLIILAAFFIPAVSFPEGFFPAAKPFPLDRLAEARRALDAARGDTEAVRAWLDAGKSPDVPGELDAFYWIEKKELPRVFQALADTEPPEWIEGEMLELGDGKSFLLYQGLRMGTMLQVLGLPKITFLYSTYEGKSNTYVNRLTKNTVITVKDDAAVLQTPRGTFEFEIAGEPTGMRSVDSTEPLKRWSAGGEKLKVRVFKDDQLSIYALMRDTDDTRVDLIIRGIPYFNPLYCAAVYGRMETLRLLIAGGASRAPMTPDGATALHAAAEWGRMEAVDALLEAGLDIDSPMDRGRTPLMAAAEGPKLFQVWMPLDPEGFRYSEREETAIHLINRSSDPARADAARRTVLFSASRHGMLALLDRLFESDVDIDARDQDGETAVFSAVRANQPAALDRLVRNGASWKVKNGSGQTPKDAAKAMRFRDCVGILEYREPLHGSFGAHIDISASTEEGYGWAPGLGGVFDLHIRLSRLFTLTGELGYAIRGTEADPDDPWLVSTEGSPYYEYQHLEAACILDYALIQGWAWRLSRIAGVGFHLQTSAIICTDCGSWEPVDIGDQLESTGLSVTVGLGLPRGVLTGLELRYMRTLGGEWTSRGGGLGSVSLLIKLGS